MKYCENCGAKLEDDDLFCHKCGSVQELKKEQKGEKTVSEKTDKALDEELGFITMETIEDLGSKALGRAEDLGSKALEKAEFFGAKASSDLQEQIEKQKAKKKASDEIRKKEDSLEAAKKKEAEKRLSDDKGSVSQTELWSWLKKSSQRKRFYTDEINNLSETDFAKLVQNKIDANAVPAKIVKKAIEWDRAGIKDTIYSIVPQTEVANPMVCILLFKHVGKFSFVEEKTFIAPPDLPEVPGEKWTLDQRFKAIIFLFIYGILSIALGVFLLQYVAFFGIAAIVTGIALVVAGSGAIKERSRVNNHNHMVDLQEQAWNKAWTEWKDNIFKHAFQEDVNGHLSRIFDSVFDCISQVCSEQFKEVKTDEQKEINTLNNLEELIQRRQDDYR